MYLEAISRFWNVFSWRLNWMWGEYMIKVTNFKIVWCAVTCLYAVTSRRLWQNASVRRTYNLHDRMRSDLWCCANKKSHHIVYWNVFRLNRYSLIVTFFLKKSWNFGTAVLLVEAMDRTGNFARSTWDGSCQTHLDDSAMCDFHLGRESCLGMCHGVCGTPRADPTTHQLDGWEPGLRQQHFLSIYAPWHWIRKKLFQNDLNWRFSRIGCWWYVIWTCYYT